MINLFTKNAKLFPSLLYIYNKNFSIAKEEKNYNVILELCKKYNSHGKNTEAKLSLFSYFSRCTNKLLNCFYKSIISYHKYFR